MEEKITITIKKSIYKKLAQLKLDKDLKTFDDVLDYVLQKSKVQGIKNFLIERFIQYYIIIYYMGKQISIYLDEEVIDAVNKIADKEERSFSSMLNILLKRLLKNDYNRTNY